MGISVSDPRLHQRCLCMDVRSLKESDTPVDWDREKLGFLYDDGPHDFSMLLRYTKTPPEKVLYNGSTERGHLSGEQLAELARKYDPTNMTQEQYQDFLDDLGSMGIISQVEKEIMGYMKGAVPLGYIDTEGDYISTSLGGFGWNSDEMDLEEMEYIVHNGSCEPKLGPGENLQKGLQALNKCETGNILGDVSRGTRKSIQLKKERLKLMTGIVNNMMEYRRVHNIPSGKQEAAETEPAEESGSLLEQARDPGGEFWLNLRNLIVGNAREKRKQAEEEAELEILDLILESAIGKGESRSRAAQQLRMMQLTREVNEYGRREFYNRTRN